MNRYKLTKARRRHTCHYCGQFIEVGETYGRLSGFGDEGPWALKQHPECAAETEKWREEDWHTHFPGDGKRPSKKEYAQPKESC